MKNLLSVAALVLGILPVAAHAGIVNLNAQISSDLGAQTLTLGPGTYDVSFAGVKGGGLYDGWNPATGNANSCAPLTPAAGLWTDRFNMTIGGVTTLYVIGNNQTYNSPTESLLAYQTSTIYAQTGNTTVNASNGKFNDISFTLKGTQNVSFSIADFVGSQWDDFGGVSLKVSPAAAATPEPASLGLLGMSLIGLGAFTRKKLVSSK